MIAELERTHRTTPYLARTQHKPHSQWDQQQTTNRTTFGYVLNHMNY